jgi:hypothetical protein
MAIQKKNFPFLISGKIGDMYGRVVNGKQFFSKMPRPSKKKPSIYQQETRSNLIITTGFMRPILPIIRKYDEPGGRKGFNKAFSHIMRHAIEGQHPNQRINCCKVVLGEGTLPNPDNHHVDSTEKGLLEFIWTMERMKRGISKSDRIFVVAYNESKQEFQYVSSGAERREKYFQMEASRFSGQQVHVWFGFSSPSSANVSTSIYTGLIKVL